MGERVLIETTDYPRALDVALRHTPITRQAYPTLRVEVSVDAEAARQYRAWRQDRKNDLIKTITKKFYFGFYHQLQDGIDGQGRPIDDYFYVG